MTAIQFIVLYLFGVAVILFFYHMVHMAYCRYRRSQQRKQKIPSLEVNEALWDILEQNYKHFTKDFTHPEKAEVIRLVLDNGWMFENAIFIIGGQRHEKPGQQD